MKVMKNRFYVLDSFRGLSAICVVLHHMRLSQSITELSFFRSSYYFVDFFFILSGFVLTHAYLNKNDMKFKNFLKARFFRIYPLHLLMFFVFLMLFAKALVSGHIDIGNYEVNTFIINALSNILLLQAWLPYVDTYSFNYPSWSISIEFYIYIIFFITMLFTNKKIIIWVVLVFLSFFLMLTDYIYFFKAEVYRGILGFFSGVLLYTIHLKIHELKINRLLATIIEGFLLLLVIVVLTLNIEFTRFIIIGIFGLSILFFSFESGYISVFLKYRVFNILGKLSYSIYMLHAAIIICLFGFIRGIERYYNLKLFITDDNVQYLNFNTPILANIFVIMTLLVVLMCSHFTYKYIEVKFQKYGKSITVK